MAAMYERIDEVIGIVDCGWRGVWSRGRLVVSLGVILLPDLPRLKIPSLERTPRQLMGGCTEPLSFAVFVPGWRDTAAWVAMSASPWLTFHSVVPKRKHVYKTGAQHREDNPCWNASVRAPGSVGE